jgi:hypothetical protein
MVNYRISINTNNYSNKTTEDKTNKKRQKQGKLDHTILFRLRHELLKISVHCQTAFAVETHLAEGETDRGKATFVPSRNTDAGCS